MNSIGRMKMIALFSLVSGVAAMLIVVFFSAMAGKKNIEIATLAMWAYLIMCMLGLLLCGFLLSFIPHENPSILTESPPPQVDLIQMPEMPPLPSKPSPANDLSKPESQLQVREPGS